MKILVRRSGIVSKQYTCYGCDDVCLYKGDAIEWEWQKFCSRACFLERLFANQYERLRFLGRI